MILTFNPIQSWIEMKDQIPELPISDWGLKYLYPVFLVLIVIEYLNAKHVYDLKESFAGLVMGIVATLIRLVTNVFEITLYMFLFMWAQDFRIDVLHYEALGFENGSLGFAWYIWVACVVLDDHNFYWHHRLAHNIRLLWAAHLPHHSGRKFNLTISIRNGWFITFFKPIYWLWMPLLGFEPLMIATCLIANAMYQFFLHSQVVPSLPLVEKVFNTSYVHVVHHSSNTQYLDRNHGGIFTFWDRLYGTWQDRIEGVDPKYGISHDPDTYNPVVHNIFEFQEIWQDVKKAPDFRSKFMYIFGPPGWSHDGSRKTAKQMQRELEESAESVHQPAAQPAAV